MKRRLRRIPMLSVGIEIRDDKCLDSDQRVGTFIVSTLQGSESIQQ